MIRAVLASAILIAASPALAQQQQLDPAFMQRAISILAGQRNQALDSVAALQVQLDQMREERDALKKQVEDLKKSAAASSP